MRLFEILLVLSNLYLLFSWFFRKEDPRKLWIASGISTLIFAGHLVMEGLRWQMAGLYFVTAAFLGRAGYKHIRKSADLKIPKLLTRSAGVFLLVLIILSTLLSVYLPVFKLPEPTGDFEVGTQTLHFVDDSRDEIFTPDPNDKREIMVQVWYPAQNTGNKNPSPVFSDGKAFLKEFAKEFKIPELLVDYFKYVKSHAYKDGEISSSSASYPLVILNHGMGTSRFFHITQAENLASHGYIVASIDHTYSTAATLFPDGRAASFVTTDEKIDTYETRSKVGKVWTQDVIFTIDQFEKINSGTIQTIFAGKVDLRNIGVFGHSFGGAAAYDSSYDSRIKAGINMDGTLYGFINKQSLTKPFMFMYSEQAIRLYHMFRPDYVPTDNELKSLGVSKEEYDKSKQNEDMKNGILENERIEKTVENGGCLLYISGTNHYNYADMQLISPLSRLIGLTGEIKGERSAYIANQYILDFFNKYLKGTGGSLLEGPSADYPEVKFASSLFDESIAK